MLIKKITLNAFGYVKVQIEGFFIQRFINLCISKGIFLDDTKHMSKSRIITNVSKDDFKNMCIVAKKTNCKVKIVKKGGIPFLIHRYRKRKIFYVMFLLLLIFSFGITRFVWNIDVLGTEKIEKSEIIKILNDNGIKPGVRISKIDIEKILNNIRLERDDISWVGAKIKGTNFIIEVKDAEEKPDIVDETKLSNIISNKKGIISKINVQSGTARVSEGDEVEEGTLLVEGVMEGKYTGNRYVNSRADIYAYVVYSKAETCKINQEVKNNTGNEYNQYKIYFNNFKINLNKGVSNFKNYDTIETKKKLRLFSNYYLPIEFEKINYKEVQIENKIYTVEEITNQLKAKLEKEILESIKGEYENFIESSYNVDTKNNEVTVTVNCKVEEKVGIYTDLVF